MKFEDWKVRIQEGRKTQFENLPKEIFFGRKDELAQLKNFINNGTKKIFFLFGIPMIGKSTLTREFYKSITDYKHISIKFNNPENPEVTIQRYSDILKNNNDEKLFVVIENFEEALQWKGNFKHLHEIKSNKVKQFVQDICKLPSVKLVLESRFYINNDFIHLKYVSELSTKQLGKIDRNELFLILNDTYRHGNVSFESFEILCDAFNDHVWLIELAMQNDWRYEDIREAVHNPTSLTQKLWEKIQSTIQKLSPKEKIILCAFGIVNPISETDLKDNLCTLRDFKKIDDLFESIISLRKKLLLVYDASHKYYEINPFLREVCYTFFREQKEMDIIEKVPYFKSSEKPKYNNIIQAQEKGDYAAFYKLIHNLRKEGKFDKVHEILQYALDNDIVINKYGVLNEIGMTYKLQKNYKKAIETFNKALADDPENVKILNELGIVYKELKEYPKAIEKLEKACEHGNIQSYNELAIIYKEQKDYSKAIETLKIALEIKDKDAKTLTTLSIVYKEKGEYSNAIKKLNEALDIETDNPITYNELAKLYIDVDDLEKALISAKNGLMLEPNDYNLNSTLKRIENKINKNTKKILEKEKILFIAANPMDETGIQTDKEYRIIKAEMERGSHRDLFEFLQPQLSVTITELLRALNDKPQMIHFSGHGDVKGIIITDESNKSLQLPIPAMERLFKPLKGITKIVVLNSCYSAEQAKSISEFGMYVVGNNLPIGDSAAISFAKGLYNGLSEGKKFESAFNDAMAVVLIESQEDANIIEVWKDGIKLNL